MSAVISRGINALLVSLLLFGSSTVAAERIKDLVSVAGVRSNQLIGYGLVVGLDGTGDSSSQPFTVQSLKNMLAQLGVVIPPNIKPQLKNAAAVMISADLPPFAKPGQTIDITVSSLGNSKSLRGGTLLMSPLKGADGQVYAIAQGNLSVGGFGAEGADGSSVSVNIQSVGRIPGGATVERSVPSPFDSADTVTLNLNTQDFTTATRVVESINRNMGIGTAMALDGGSVRVQAPLEADKKVMFVAMLENLTVEPGEAPARVIINSRTGTIVIGNHVKVMPAAVSHGSLTVTISEAYGVSQPLPFSDGETVVVPSSGIEVSEENNPMFLFEPGTTLNDLVRAVNQVGAAPGDLVAILEALKVAGALHAELLVI
ncbi:MAG: flagellar basal body P-ring protein FlgI [Gammaproteobacteria bacterium]